MFALAEAVEECAGYLGVMEPEEVAGVRGSLPSGFRDLFESAVDCVDREEYLLRLAVFHLTIRLSRRWRRSFFEEMLRATPGSGEPFRAFPELEGKLDDDGLLVVDGDLRLLEVGD